MIARGALESSPAAAPPGGPAASVVPAGAPVATAPLPKWLALAVPLVLSAIWRIQRLAWPPHGNHAWRDADGIGVARGFLHDSWNLLLPHVAERGGKSGIVGMELPFVDWLSAASMRLFGESYLVARLPVYLCLPVLLWATLALGRRVLGSEAAGRLAAAFIVLQPMVLVHARKLMPEVPMLTLLVLGALAAHAALRRGSWPMTWAGAGALALAAMLKPTVICLGAALAVWGVQALREAPAAARRSLLARATVLAAVPLACAALWYHHARRVDALYGLSWFKLHHDWRAAVRLLGSIDYDLFERDRLVTFIFSGAVVWLAVFQAPVMLRILRERLGLALWLLASVALTYLMGEQNYSHIYYAIPMSAPACLLAGELVAECARPTPHPRFSQASFLGIYAYMTLTCTIPFFDGPGYDFRAVERTVQRLGPAPLSVVTDTNSPVVSLVRLRRNGWSLPAASLTPETLRRLRAEGARELVESDFGGWLTEAQREALPPPRYADAQLRIYDLLRLPTPAP